jgi:hypothetical protein
MSYRRHVAVLQRTVSEGYRDGSHTAPPSLRCTTELVEASKVTPEIAETAMLIAWCNPVTNFGLQARRDLYRVVDKGRCRCSQPHADVKRSTCIRIS